MSNPRSSPREQTLGMDPTVWAKLHALRTVPTEGGRRLLIDPTFPAEVIEAIMAADLPSLTSADTIFAKAIWKGWRGLVENLLNISIAQKEAYTIDPASLGPDEQSQEDFEEALVNYSLAYGDMNSKFLNINCILRPVDNGVLISFHLARLAIHQLLNGGAVALINQQNIEQLVFTFMFVHTLDHEGHKDIVQRHLGPTGVVERWTGSSARSGFKSTQNASAVVELPHHELAWPGTYSAQRMETKKIKVALGTVRDNATIGEAWMSGRSWGLAMRVVIPDNVERFNERNTRMDGKDFTTVKDDTEFFAERLEHFATHLHQCFMGSPICPEAREAFFLGAKDALVGDGFGEKNGI